MRSSRLPGKVLLPAGGKPLLQILLERLQHARGVSQIVVATTVNPADDPIVQLAQAMNIAVFRGSETDVLGRVCGALRTQQATTCVEITADCPLLDPQLVEEAIAEYQATSASHPYISNSDPHRSVPAGFDVQVFSADALEQLNRLTSDPMDREHVSYGFYRPESENRWNPRFITHPSCRGAEDLWLTLDYEEDYVMIRRIHEELSQNTPLYRAAEIVAWSRSHPEYQERCRQVRKDRAHV
jgi:spore coat polysaccharide biosynthesis protein SpsF